MTAGDRASAARRTSHGSGPAPAVEAKPQPLIIHIVRGKADPNTLNGVNRIVHGLATAQLKRGQRVEVWGISDSPDDVRHQHEYPLRMFRAFGLALRPTRELRNAIVHLPPPHTIVHFHSVLVREFYAISRELDARGIDWVHSPHGGYNPMSMRRNWLLKRLYFTLFEHRLPGHAAAVLATGRSEVGDIARVSRGARAVYIPNGQERQPRIETILAANVARPLFGYCGRLAMRHKGLDLLLDGFVRYVRAGGHGTLWLIGDGEDKERLSRDATALGLDGRLAFKGPQFGDAKTEMLCQLDCFVHPSRWEGLPMVLLDAAALELPMIISKQTNFDEFVRADGSGIVLEQNTPEEIARALLGFEQEMDADTLGPMRDAARRAASTRPDWDVISERIERELYGFAPSPTHAVATAATDQMPMGDATLPAHGASRALEQPGELHLGGGLRRPDRLTGLMVVVAGPDGVGKSTLLEALQQRSFDGALSVASRRHLRPHVIAPSPNRNRPIADPHGKPPYGPIGSLAKLLMLYADYTLGHLVTTFREVRHSRVVLYDRHFQDILADPLRFRYAGPAWLARLAVALAPRPDLMLILDADPANLFARKQETSIDEHARQARAYQALAEDFPFARLLDADQPQEAVRTDAEQLISDYLAKRQRRRLGRS